MRFAVCARLIALIMAALFVVLFFAPSAYAPTYGVVENEGVQFLTRRAAPMFIGPCVILWVASTAPRTPLRDAVAIGTALTFIGIAISGIWAWGQGIATPGILVAAVLECGMAAALWASRKN